MAESYVQRWARENAERSVAEQKEKTEQKSDMTEEKGVGPGEQNARCEGQTPKKNKTRRKNA
jgi:hypothetical protein